MNEIYGIVPPMTTPFDSVDQLDEDAFRALAERGITIVVSETPRCSAARYVMQNTAQVQTFLQGLATALCA